MTPENQKYYEQIASCAKTYVMHFTCDYEKYDKEYLEKRPNIKRFLWAIRDSGTDILDIGDWNELSAKENADCLRYLDVWILGMYNNHNDRFFIGENGRLTEIPKAKAVAIRNQLAMDWDNHNVVKLEYLAKYAPSLLNYPSPELVIRTS